MAKYVKLGKKAASFADPYSELTLAGKDVKELTPKQQVSPKVQRALLGGHLVTATKEEFETWSKKESGFKAEVAVKKTAEMNKLKTENEELKGRIAELEEAMGKKAPEKAPEDKFSGMVEQELIKYYKDNYEVTKEEVATFKKLEKTEMVVELVKLEKETSG